MTLDLVLVDDGTTATDTIFQFGIGGPASPATLLVVPKPTSIALLAVGGFVALRRPRWARPA